MLRTFVCVALLLTVGGMSSGQEASSPLSDEGRAFLEALQSAGWSGHTAANGVDLTVRAAPLGSSGMLNAARNRGSLSEAERKALDDVARVVLPSEGWFFTRLVPAGTYHIGLDFDRGYPRTTLSDASGRRLADRPFWIYQTTDENTACSVTASRGSVMATLDSDGIRLTYRFVPKARHDALTSSLETTTAGPVRLHSDLPAKAELEKLAKDAAAALAVHAKLLGCKVPDGRFDIYLFADASAFDAMDGLLTGGDFKSSRAFTARATGRSYFSYGLMKDKDALADHGIPLKDRSVVLHEIHHQVAGRAFPFSIENWPSWIAEGLAEVGTRKALLARSRADGKAFNDLYLGNWLHADRAGTVPPVADLVGGGKDSGITGWYTTCYLIGRLMAEKPKRVHQLVAAMNGVATAPEAAVRAREEFVRLYGSVESVVERVARSARARRDPPPAVLTGRLDTIDGVWRVISAPESPALLILPTKVESADATSITTSFTFHPSGQQQLDLYLCHRKGRHKEQFLKVAVLPKKIMLFWHRHGSWRTCGTVNYDKPLDVGTATKRVWHSITVKYVVADRKVRVDTTGGRWAEFVVPGYVPTAGTYAGIGLYNGVAYFKDTTVR